MANNQINMINTSSFLIKKGDVLIADLANSPTGCKTTTLSDDQVIGIAITSANPGQSI